jgi:hypothetical protein
MSNYELWKKLPVFSAKNVERKLIATELIVLKNPGSQLSDLSHKWKKQDMTIISSTDYQEDLVAILISASLGYLTAEAYLPACLAVNAQNSAVDRVIVSQSDDARFENEFAGLQVQIVSTHGLNSEYSDQITELIINRVKQKTAKGATYSEGINLAVLVTQTDWSFNARELTERLAGESSYEGLWVILPMNIEDRISFAVNYFQSGEDEFGEGQLIVDITDNIMVRHIYLYQLDGKLDDLIEYMTFKYIQKKDS